MTLRFFSSLVSIVGESAIYTAGGSASIARRDSAALAGDPARRGRWSGRLE
jgi:hypothetical protein